MLKAIAIDDEPLALGLIENFCERTEDIQLLKTFTRPLEGLKYLNNFPVDLLFLDIQMPSLTGIQLVSELKQEVKVIFTTAYDNFALEGFNLNAIDYLLKPFSYERFMQAIAKAKKMGQKQDAHSTPYITVRADYSLIKIDLNKIRYIEGLDDYIKIHLNDSKTIVARSTMKSILEILPEEQFVRVHRSFIVPKNNITAVKNKTLLLGEVSIPIGNSYVEKMADLFGR
ncbi:MAG: LytTR family DNA-binding domain-containing protein [bacterium]|nr:LytTR family DNA-binding domain-containing protein [bacterium]